MCGCRSGSHFVCEGCDYLISLNREGLPLAVRNLGENPNIPVLPDARRSRLLALENASVKEPLGQCTGTVVFSGNRPAIVSVLLSEELLFSLLWVSVALCFEGCMRVFLGRTWRLDSTLGLWLGHSGKQWSSISQVHGPSQHQALDRQTRSGLLDGSF